MGSVIHLTLSINANKGEGEAVFDFAGTSAEVYGNWNAPEAVTAAAVIYCVWCLVNVDIPLNQGCLAPVKILIPEAKHRTKLMLLLSSHSSMATRFPFNNASSLARAVVSGNFQENPLQAPLWSRSNSTQSSLAKDNSTNEGFKGHDMLAAFTARWQTTDSKPLIIDKSEGSYVYDFNGKKYLDSLAGLWCTALGGSEPHLIDAAIAQLKKFPFYHSFWNRTTKPSLDLAKELLEIFIARKMAKAFFVNSGSEANDTQVKLVWYYNSSLGRPDKKKFIARAKSYS
ncbi:hypothetical protein RJT34_21505 [Clitoria ternatea]|uniref:Hydantoinase B/oxoprolinase domain-containing protein n=1 Tax=Clitoria ternatea TaxID=43366 RepID=A0AAN9IUM4_CLITE